jgi:outer membrane protein assembly factor BamB
MRRSLPLALTIYFSLAVLQAADWPQWQGPDRSRISKETGLLKVWPADGPPVVWTATGLGSGYGSMAIAGGRVYVQAAIGKNSGVIALNRTDGKVVWSKAVGPAQGNQQGGGPRSTPTIDGDRLYVLTESGDLACLGIDGGTTMWQRNILRDFRGQQIQWLISESPLVDGPHVVVYPGGRGAGMVKLDKMTGATVWTSRDLSDPAGYSSVIAADVGGVRTYMTFTASAGVGVRASDGKLLFRYGNAAHQVANIATPVFSNNKVFFTSAYGTGGGLVDLTAQDGEVKARQAYFTRDMRNHHGGVVLVDGYLYGFSDAIPDDTIRDLEGHPAFAGVARLLLPWDDRVYESEMRLRHIGSLLPYHTHVNPESVVNALNHMIADVNGGRSVFYDVYSAGEKRNEPTKANTGLFFFRGKPGAPFAVISPGGGFSYVGSVHEGFPYAVAISRQGYNAFVLKYRAGSGGEVATRDLAAAVSYLFRNAGALGRRHRVAWGCKIRRGRHSETLRGRDGLHRSLRLFGQRAPDVRGCRRARRHCPSIGYGETSRGITPGRHGGRVLSIRQPGPWLRSGYRHQRGGVAGSRHPFLGEVDQIADSRRPQ